MSDLSALQAALRGLGIDPQAELERYRRTQQVNGGLVPAPAASPEDYLASSEQLLQQIAANEPQPMSAGRQRLRFSPLLLASAVTIAGTVGLLFRGLRQRSVSPVAAVRPATVSPARPRALLLDPQDPGNLSRGPAALPHVKLPARSDGPESDRASAGAAATVAAARPDLEAGFFYVTLEPTDADLAQVRQWIPDAFVVQFPIGNRIQAGAFHRREQAERAARQLQDRGLPATVYQPQ